MTELLMISSMLHYNDVDYSTSTPAKRTELHKCLGIMMNIVTMINLRVLKKKLREKSMAELESN